MYAKLKPNGQIQPAPRTLVIRINNPTDERLEYEGYRKVIETNPPDYDPEKQHPVSHYEDAGDSIIQAWDLVDNPPEPESEPTMQDLEDAIKEAINSDN